MATFLSSYSYPVIFYITLKMDRFSHQFLITWANAAKFVLREDPGYGNFCPTYCMVTVWNINTHVFLKIWVISLSSNLRSGYLKTQSPHLLQNVFLLTDLIPTKWASRHFVQATSFYMEQDKHLKIFCLCDPSVKI